MKPVKAGIPSRHVRRALHREAQGWLSGGCIPKLVTSLLQDVMCGAVENGQGVTCAETLKRGCMAATLRF